VIYFLLIDSLNRSYKNVGSVDIIMQLIKNKRDIDIFREFFPKRKMIFDCFYFPIIRYLLKNKSNATI